MVTYSELFEFAMVLMTFANLGIQIVGLIVQVHIARKSDRRTFHRRRSLSRK
jgi:hypothetical protein